MTDSTPSCHISAYVVVKNKAERIVARIYDFFRQSGSVGQSLAGGTRDPILGLFLACFDYATAAR
jgi:hypothetical protein